MGLIWGREDGGSRSLSSVQEGSESKQPSFKAVVGILRICCTGAIGIGMVGVYRNAPCGGLLQVAGDIPFSACS